MKEKGQKAEKETGVRELSWPKLDWRRSTTYYTLAITLVIAVLTILFFAFPELFEGRSVQYRIVIVILIILSTILLYTLTPWLCRLILTIIKRVVYYTEMWRAYLETKVGFTEVQNTLVKCFGALEINLVRSEGGKLYLELARKSGENVEVGDMVAVMDLRDFMWLGQFKITDIHSEVYYAEEANSVDPLWKTYVKNQGEIKFTTNKVAIHIPQRRK